MTKKNKHTTTASKDELRKFFQGRITLVSWILPIFPVLLAIGWWGGVRAYVHVLGVGLLILSLVFLRILKVILAKIDKASPADMKNIEAGAVMLGYGRWE